MQHSLGTIGYCIYCGARDEPLSDEHVLPQGLGGRDFLAKASCTACAKRTSLAEQEVLRGCTWPARAEMGMRGKGKKRPETVDAKILAPSGETQTIAVAPESLLIKALIPTWVGPQFMTGEVDTVEGGFWCSINPDVEETVEGQQHKLNLYLIAKAIGKIAHCVAVARYERSEVAFFVPDLVLAKEENFARLVGCSAPAMPRERAFHWSDVYEVAAAHGRALLMGRVRLFANLGGPIFHVVVGELGRPATNARSAMAVGAPPEQFMETVQQMHERSAGSELRFNQH